MLGCALGCGALSSAPEEAALGAQQCQQLARRVLDHSCQHARLGPFEELRPSFEGSVSPDISRSHTTFQLVDPSGRGGETLLLYRPSRDGQHVIFVRPATDLTLEASSGEQPLPHLHEQLISACDELSQGQVFELERGSAYTLRLEVPPLVLSGDGKAPPAASVFIEHLGTFSEPYEESCSAK